MLASFKIKYLSLRGLITMISNLILLISSHPDFLGNIPFFHFNFYWEFFEVLFKSFASICKWSGQITFSYFLYHNYSGFTKSTGNISSLFALSKSLNSIFLNLWNNPYMKSFGFYTHRERIGEFLDSVFFFFMIISLYEIIFYFPILYFLRKIN